jgi:hypothetical protein
MLDQLRVRNATDEVDTIGEIEVIPQAHEPSEFCTLARYYAANARGNGLGKCAEHEIEAFERGES